MRGRATTNVVKLEPPPPPSAPVARGGWQRPAGLEGFSRCAADLIAEAKRPPDFVIDRIAEAGDVILLTGQEKITFKTWIAIALARAIITGGTWLGFEVARARLRRPLIISTETRGVVVTRRLLSLCEGNSDDGPEVAQHLEIIDEPVTILPAAKLARAFDRARAKVHLQANNIHDDTRRARLARDRDAIADVEVSALGTNVHLLGAIATPDTWSLIIVDTLRECLAGDENDSDAARDFIAGCRELARECGCPILIIHHTNKTGAQGEMRSARGSGQFTGGPDAIISIDASGEYPTAHFEIRNHAPVEPVGYKLSVDIRGASIDTMAACVGSNRGISEDDVMAIFRAHPRDGLTETKVRELLAKAKNPNAKPGAKAHQKSTCKALDALVTRMAISECTIDRGGRKAPFSGYRLGSTGGVVPAVRISNDDGDGPIGMGNAHDV